MSFFSKGLKYQFETAMVNEPSVFEPLKFYCSNSNEYTKYTIFSIKKEIHPKLSHICSFVILSKGLKNEFEIALATESPVFEPLKFYCILLTALFFQCLPGSNDHISLFSFGRMLTVVIQVYDANTKNRYNLLWFFEMSYNSS